MLCAFVYICRELADNKVFFQHPDLMRALGVHETVMQLMVNTLNKAQQQSSAADIDTVDQKRRSSVASTNADMVSDTAPTRVRLICQYSYETGH